MLPESLLFVVTHCLIIENEAISVYKESVLDNTGTVGSNVTSQLIELINRYAEKHGEAIRELNKTEMRRYYVPPNFGYLDGDLRDYYNIRNESGDKPSGPLDDGELITILLYANHHGPSTQAPVNVTTKHKVPLRRNYDTEYTRNIIINKPELIEKFNRRTEKSDVEDNEQARTVIINNPEVIEQFMRHKERSTSSDSNEYSNEDTINDRRNLRRDDTVDWNNSNRDKVERAYDNFDKDWDKGNEKAINDYNYDQKKSRNNVNDNNRDKTRNNEHGNTKKRNRSENNSKTGEEIVWDKPKHKWDKTTSDWNKLTVNVDETDARSFKKWDKDWKKQKNNRGKLTKGSSQHEIPAKSPKSRFIERQDYRPAYHKSRLRNREGGMKGGMRTPIPFIDNKGVFED